MPSTDTVADTGTDQRVSRRRGRYAAQRIAWDLTTIKRVAHCGRVVGRGPDGQESFGVAVKVTGTPGTPDARAGFSGLQTCGSVWSCPVCAEKVNAGRQAELEAGIRAWLADGHALLFGTLTLRHHRGDRLADLLDAISPAWNRTTSGAGVAWNGSKRATGDRGDRARFGIEGYVRVVETKWGQGNGWHPHVHFLLFIDKELSKTEVRDLEARMFGRWEAALAKQGKGYSTLAGVGIDLRPVRDGAGMSDYFTKASQASDPGAAAYEVTGSQSKRLGKADSLTPFEVLRRCAVVEDELGGVCGRQAVALWHEWEQASHNRRQMTWSRGLRARLVALSAGDLDEVELTDQELAELDQGGDVVAVITKDDWNGLRLARRRVELLEAAERGTLVAWLRVLREDFGHPPG